MSSWQRWALNRPLNWWLSPIAIQIHTHCAGCGGRLSRPTHGPGLCQSCNHSENASAATRLPLRIAPWLALAIIYAMAFHYAKKYEAEMLTDAGHVESLAPSDRRITDQIIQISITHQERSHV
jgi:hypothetical protein